MNCNGCGNDKAYRLISRISAQSRQDSCDRCGDGPTTTMPDVYWPGHPHFNPQLVDNQGKPIFLESRTHKAKVLREKGLVEAGDRHHGAPYAPSGHWKECVRASNK